MAQSIRIPGEEMALIRREAELSSPDTLTGEERPVYLDALLSAAGEGTTEEAALFAHRRKKGLGVGHDEAGRFAKQKAKAGK